MAATNKKTFNGVEVEQILDDAKRGVEANMGPRDAVSIAGTRMNKQEVLNAIAKRKKYFEAAAAKHLELNAAVVARDQQLGEMHDFIKAFDGGITAEYGTDPNVKAKYGIPKVQPRRQLTAEQVAIKAQKLRDTRKKRNTMGDRQKEDVKAEGTYSLNVSSGAAVSIATPAAPAPSPSAPVAIPAPVATPPQPAPSAGESAPQVNGAANGVSNSAVAPMLMNGAGH
jgi:hypothetical protein